MLRCHALDVNRALSKRGWLRAGTKPPAQEASRRQQQSPACRVLPAAAAVQPQATLRHLNKCAISKKGNPRKKRSQQKLIQLCTGEDEVWDAAAGKTDSPDDELLQMDMFGGVWHRS